MNKKIETLKKLTLEKNANFSQCLHYFLDLMDDDRFMSAGALFTGDDTLYKALLEPAINHSGENAKLDTLLLISMKQHQLIHGSGKLSNHKMIMFYYFEDIQCGMASVAKLGDDKTHFFRITLLQTGSAFSPIMPVVH